MKRNLKNGKRNKDSTKEKEMDDGMENLVGFFTVLMEIDRRVNGKIKKEIISK